MSRIVFSLDPPHSRARISSVTIWEITSPQDMVLFNLIERV